MAVEELNKEINLDSVLESVGPYGRYNLLYFVLLLFPILLSGCYICSFIFEAPEEIYRCKIDVCEGMVNDTSWPEFAIPYDPEKGRPDSCKRFAPIEENNLQCTPDAFNKSKTIPCDGYVYKDGQSFVKEFDLGCQEWKRMLIGSVHNAGMLAAMLFTGLISDRFGRKIALGFAAINRFIFGLSRAFMPTYISYLIMHFLEGCFGGALYLSSYVFVMELVGLKQRALLSVICNITIAMGIALLAVLAWFVTYWRTYIIVLYTPAIFIVFYVWFMNDSARWLLSKGRRDEAGEILKSAAKMNKLNTQTLDLDSLADPLIRPQHETKNKLSQFSMAVRSVIIWKRLMICSFIWFTSALVYYGLSITSVSVNENKYVSFTLVSLIDIPALIVVAIVLDKIGRKKTLIIGYLTCAITCFLFAFLPRSNWWSVALYLMGKWGVTVSFGGLYVYVSEVFPTNMRQTLISVCSISGRIGSLIAPMTPLLSVYHKSMPIVIFGGMCVISCLLVLMLPETRNMRLPDTVEEAENLTKMKSLDDREDQT